MGTALAQILENMRLAYLSEMQSSDGGQPYLTADRLCHKFLSVDVDRLAEIVVQDPTLLAARAGGLIVAEGEVDNPSAAAIISSNLFAAAMEGLLSTAVENAWLRTDDDGAILVDQDELDRQGEYTIEVDYSHSDVARDNLTKPGVSALSEIFNKAEVAFAEALQVCSHDAYQQALTLSSEYAVFSPDELAPLVEENPLLLGLRGDDLIDETLFEGDPPAGLIISGHLTRMLMQQLLDIAVAEGVLSVDSEGQVIVPEEGEKPILH